MKRFLILIFVLASAAAVGAYGWYNQQLKLLHQPLANSANNANATFEIKPGSNLDRIIADLKSRNIIENEKFVQIYARLNMDSRGIKAGEYNIPSGITPAQLLDSFVKGDVIQHSITFIEGWRFDEMIAALKRHPQLVHQTDLLTTDEIMEKLGMAGQHPEGRFFPDTFFFTKNSKDLDILRRANKLMEKHLNESWQLRDTNTPLKSPYEALILASIIEKETSVNEEKPRVGGVFIKRLQKNMKLETDPTVIYGMGDEFDGNIRKKDLRTDTLYNTYTRFGLPPTPIANPGLEAIKAAVKPVIDGSLFFVAKGDGTHHFSKTYRQHLNAVRRYQLKR